MEKSLDSHSATARCCDKAGSAFFFRLPIQEKQDSLASLSPIHLSEWGVPELYSCWENVGRVSLPEGGSQYSRLPSSGSSTGAIGTVTWAWVLFCDPTYLLPTAWELVTPQLKVLTDPLRRYHQSLSFIFTLKPTRSCFLFSLSVFSKSSYATLSLQLSEPYMTEI